MGTAFSPHLLSQRDKDSATIYVMNSPVHNAQETPLASAIPITSKIGTLEFNIHCRIHCRK